MSTMIKRLAYVAVALALVMFAPTSNAEVGLDHLHRADDARIVPEKFLRSWDPVTIFFERDVGPASGGPEDRPERLGTGAPATAGASQRRGARRPRVGAARR